MLNKNKFQKMSKKKVEISVVLDRSGSMSSIVNQTISGYNEFMHGQKTVDADIKVSLVQFDHEYEVKYEAIPIVEVPELDHKTYVPRGMTALLDAIGRTIKNTKQRHANMDKDERPDKVIFVIITDGHENSSVQYRRGEIFEEINYLEKMMNWEFVYLGANQDAIGEAASFGITREKAMTFDADELGAVNMFQSLSKSIKHSLSHNRDFAFAEEDRKKHKSGR
jgi:uncharacterized protein YegL